MKSAVLAAIVGLVLIATAAIAADPPVIDHTLRPRLPQKIPPIDRYKGAPSPAALRPDLTGRPDVEFRVVNRILSSFAYRVAMQSYP
jgi:hypothetical protein